MMKNSLADPANRLNPLPGILPAILLMACGAPVLAADECAPSGEYQCLCGIQNAKDLMHVPGNDWIISSSLKLGDAWYLIDAANKSWSSADAWGAVRVEQGTNRFPSCPRPFSILSIDPQSMAVQTVATGPIYEVFSNITLAVTIRNELWIGTFAGDQFAYEILPP